MSLFNNPQVLAKCREYEKKFPIAPESWKDTGNMQRQTIYGPRWVRCGGLVYLKK